VEAALDTRANQPERHALRSILLRTWEFAGKSIPRLRGLFYRYVLGLPFRRVGRNLKVRGGRAMVLGRSVTVGDNCWLEAVVHYKGRRYSPRLRIGNEVALSDSTHISAALAVDIGDGCLIGSKVYIGDHGHGSLRERDVAEQVFPADRPLGDIAPISIGSGCWIGDGAVILAGSRIAPDSVIGANSVVRLTETRPALIVGVPARVSRYLD